jgi:hypothetical protein
MDAHYLAPTDEDLKRAMDRYTDSLDRQLEVAVTQNVTLGSFG